MESNIKSFFYHYNNFIEASLVGKNHTTQQIYDLLNKIKSNKIFSVRKIGTSVENRPIYSVTFGRGKTKILAWSQMHGDEPTATRVFFDFLNFLQLPENKDFFEQILSRSTINFIPQLNPDGTELNIRENALGIDINRDAATLISPEARILNKTFSKFKPHFSLNLHDQDCYHSVGDSQEPVWLSFLATVPDAKKQNTPARKRSINVIGKTCFQLKKSGIKNITRYNDEYEPRAFGDNFAKQGSSVILIEAGCAEKSKNKSFERKLFFSAFVQIIQNIIDYDKTDYSKHYNSLPENKDRMLDFILDDVKLSGKFNVSIGVKENKIEAVGDLSVYGCYERISAKGLIFEGKSLPGGKANFKLIDKTGNIVLTSKNGNLKWAK